MKAASWLRRLRLKPDQAPFYKNWRALLRPRLVFSALKIDPAHENNAVVRPSNITPARCYRQGNLVLETGRLIFFQDENAVGKVGKKLAMAIRQTAMASDAATTISRYCASLPQRR